MSEVAVRAATEEDIDAIREIFIACYKADYPYRHFFDTQWLKRAIYSDNVVTLVAQDAKTQTVLGTASIVLDIGADSDLIGEFGRLAVHPDARSKGIGACLMQARLECAEERLHVALVEARTEHAFSQRIAFHHGFVAVGLLPQKHYLRRAESVVLAVRYFGDALSLRRNHPRVVPEVKPLAHLSLTACGLNDDVIVEETLPAYPTSNSYAVGALTVERYSPLLRIERGRTKGREVFGARTLSQGLFKLTQSNGEYLIATRERGDDVVGAVGLLRDEFERTIKVFELVFSEEGAVSSLLRAVLEQSKAWKVRYVEIDVHANAARMQRTLVELGFVPGAYVPAMVFVDVERVDAVRFVFLSPEGDATPVASCQEAKSAVELVSSQFAKRQVLPKLRDAVRRLAPFHRLSSEQEQRLLAACSLRDFETGSCLFVQNEPADGFFLILAGDVGILRDGDELAKLGAGDLLGEYSAISDECRSVTAKALGIVQTAHVSAQELAKLARGRPDIAAALYRNLALALGRKLRAMDDVVTTGGQF